MRASLKLFPALIMAVILTVGCASSNSKTLSDEEILEKVSPYLEQLVYQDPASYVPWTISYGPIWALIPQRWSPSHCIWALQTRTPAVFSC